MRVWMAQDNIYFSALWYFVDAFTTSPCHDPFGLQQGDGQMNSLRRRLLRDFGTPVITKD